MNILINLLIVAGWVLLVGIVYSLAEAIFDGLALKG